VQHIASAGGYGAIDVAMGSKHGAKEFAAKIFGMHVDKPFKGW